MARQKFDIGSKWLIQNQSKGVLFVGGLANVRTCMPMPGEIVQNRRYPDGLLQAYFDNDPTPRHVLVEAATYPEKRALKQALDDLTLAYSALGHLPEMLMLVLRPKGKFRIAGPYSIESEYGSASLQANWRTVEMWTLPAEMFLAEGDLGILPWVPLMRWPGRPESLLERCAERIEREATPKDRTDLLVVSQVMASLTYPSLNLFRFFGGEKIMVESPLIQKVIANKIQELILEALKDRFEAVPRDVPKELHKITNEKKLKRLNKIANNCSDLDAFREAMQS